MTAGLETSGAEHPVQVAVGEDAGRVQLVAYAEEVVEVRVDRPERVGVPVVHLAPVRPAAQRRAHLLEALEIRLVRHSNILMDRDVDGVEGDAAGILCHCKYRDNRGAGKGNRAAIGKGEYEINLTLRTDYAKPLVRADLCNEAIRLGGLVRLLMAPPPPAEVTGLVALMLLHDSRRDARAKSIT